MNAPIARFSSDIAAVELTLPEPALRRLRLRLGQAVATGEALTASIGRGVAPDTFEAVIDDFCDGFEPERQPVFGLPCFATRVGEQDVSFVHARSSERFAMPLLLLHGYCGSVAEFQDLVEPLTHPPEAAQPCPAFHVVCPALPGFGASYGAPDVRAIAAAYAELMARLGYDRYLVHGSDLGANAALELAAQDEQHVAGALVTSLNAFPSEAADEAASLTRAEKSQLALLTSLHDEYVFDLAESPLEQLAFALAQLDNSIDQPFDTKAVRALLVGLALAEARGDPSSRRALYRATRLAPAPPSRVPLAVHTFPLDAPSLRRFASREHRVVDWVEHETGGCLPALEQPELLLASLRGFFAQFL